MLSIFRRKTKEQPKSYHGKNRYKQVAVTPAAHAKLISFADKNDTTIIDTVDQLVGV